jgi:uncharacterized protein (DUF433 family)
VDAEVEAPDRDPLNSGFFTLREAARLIGPEMGRQIAYWLNGRDTGRLGPVIQRDFAGSELSFLDLMEARFIAHFRSHGVSMATIRCAAGRLRAEWGVRHPFAMANSTRYLTDRRHIFLQAARDVGDTAPLTVNLGTNQLVMWNMIEASVADGVAFHPVSEEAVRWHPRPATFPGVRVDPCLSFGRPVIGDKAMPTATLFRQWQAEGGDHQRVAFWFSVPEGDVEQAVAFEKSLAA